MRRLPIIALLLVALFAIAGAPKARAEAAGWLGGAVEVPDRDGDAAVAAGAVTLSGRVAGDALLAAGEARLNGIVAGDARVLAGDYSQIGSVGGELSVASGKVMVDGIVGDDFYGVGRDIKIGPEAHIGKNVRVGAEDVLIKGRIDGNLDVSADVVAISARIGGDVRIKARRIIIGADTTIDGKLYWRAAETPEIPAEAIIRGGATGEVAKEWDRERGWSWDRPWRAVPDAVIVAGAALARVMVGISAFLLGVLILLIAPSFADRMATSLLHRWPAAAAWGLAFLIGMPALAMLLLLTIVGIPLGVLALLAYPVLLLCGYVSGAASIGALAASGMRQSSGPPSLRRRLFALAIGLVALTAAGFVPLVGGLIGFVVTIVGIGLMAISWRREPEIAG